MCKVWWMLPNTSCSPCSPQVPLHQPGGIRAHCSGKWRRTPLITSIYGGHSDGLLPRASAPAASEQILVQSPGVMLYFINLPEQIFARWTLQLVSAATFAFFLVYWRPVPCNAPFVVKYFSGTSSHTQPFLLQTWEGYQHPKFSAEALEVAASPRVRCVLGNILAFKEASPRIPLQFIYRKKQGKSFVFL